MKVFDTLIALENVPLNKDTRLRHGQVYAWCHSANKEHENKAVARKQRYFVFSNALSNKHVLCRSLEEPSELGLTVSYYPTSYKDFLVFQGTGHDIKKRKWRLKNLSKQRRRYVLNTRTGEVVKKIEVVSKGGTRPINLVKAEFFSVKIDQYEKEFLGGIGGRLSYGCGLIIPTQVYNHLLNFVKK